ncbi:hypothetical protein [Marinobacter sp.]|uniref:hypothetical protein n=1 Tax=Marinobacter sp. TaxID=50741 RepID=UPI0019ED585C|nr:hypothetical protein [Marinobacter sp.]MBE0485468.1 hypothetical protein [Marinobacter sp.]
MANTHRHPNAQNHDRLRHSARRLIDRGIPPPSGGGSISAEALQLLYQQASSPETAADALRLLHELQTYQVELDMLYEQLQANEQAMTDELLLYKTLFDRAPAAYFVLNRNGDVIESNQAASALIEGPEPVLECNQLSALAERAGASTLATVTSLALPDQRQLTIHTRLADNTDTVLIILTETRNSDTTP